MSKRLILSVVLIATLTHCVQAVKTVKINPNCPEIPATTFEKVGLDAKAGALQFGKLVTVGEFNIKADPQIISGISQSVRDDQITDALVCAARERGELQTGEQIEHAWKVARFYRTNPTPNEAIEFHKQNSLPGAAGKKISETDRKHVAAIRQLVGEGYSVKNNIEQEYRAERQQNTFQTNADILIKRWNTKVSAWNGKVRSALQSIDPLLFERFTNIKGTAFARVGENNAWDSLDNNINARIEFLNRYLDAISESALGPRSEELSQIKEHIAASITGGNSFAYISPTFLSAAHNSPLLTLVHQGEYPLYDLKVRIVDLEKFEKLVRQPHTFYDFQRDETHIDLGNIAMNQVRMLGPIQLKGELIRLNLFFSARNGFFEELLRVRRVGDAWKVAVQVKRKKLPSGEHELLLERVDPGYPVGKDGRIEWE